MTTSLPPWKGQSRACQHADSDEGNKEREGILFGESETMMNARSSIKSKPTCKREEFVSGNSSRLNSPINEVLITIS